MTAFSTAPHPLLQAPPLSLAHDTFARLLAETENLLIVQDLDGVCMGLVKDPLTREIDRRYVEAVRAFNGHFYVLTNGEHAGRRGVNGIVERALGDRARQEGLYLPGLAAGGVQWQDRFATLSHPGVSDRELEFLAAVPDRAEACLRAFCADRPLNLDRDRQDACIVSAVLDNRASPTVNLNAFYAALQEQPDAYAALQDAVRQLMDDLLADAARSGLGDSFFVHYAPNLGRDPAGLEVLRPARDGDSGTTDFQFMLRGAVKEAGVLALLNRYLAARTGRAPLGDDFSVRQAPRSHAALLDLAREAFDPASLPLVVGVGDTVTSTVEDSPDGPVARRGGSDRGFLQLVQDLGLALDRPNLVVYVDSSAGEVKNRRPLTVKTGADGQMEVTAGPGDPRDRDDPLRLDLVFPDGHWQYIDYFCRAAGDRARRFGPGG